MLNTAMRHWRVRKALDMFMRYVKLALIDIDGKTLAE
jgi:hypothetical protein